MTTFEGLAAMQRGAGVGPSERRGLLRATGADARDYLHRMLTQAVKGLAAGESRYACLLTATGHLVAEGHLLGLDDGLLLDLDPLALAEARATLERFVIADDVTFEDLSQTHAAVPVLGPGAAAAVASLGLPGALVIEDGRRGAPARVLVLPAGEAAEARARLLAGGAASLTAADLESLRLAGGFARFGLDMGPERLPMEAGLTRSAIAFDKGCYVGQEVVLRATVRGQIQKGLVQLALPPEVGAGSGLRAGGAEVGAVTSAADWPEGRLGLAIVKRSAWPAGTRLATDGGEAVVLRLLVEEPPPAAAL
jgi:folate-binding protein YgfZ